MKFGPWLCIRLGWLAVEVAVALCGYWLWWSNAFWPWRALGVVLGLASTILVGSSLGPIAHNVRWNWKAAKMMNEDPEGYAKLKQQHEAALARLEAEERTTASGSRGKDESY
jgi:hypothetical protein